jgi:hypothetical protein
MGTKFPMGGSLGYHVGPLFNKESQMNQTSQTNTTYAKFADHVSFLAKAMEESGADTVYSVSRNSGKEGLTSLLHVLNDYGHREVLIHALNSPAITGWVRESMECFLYGEGRQTAWLFKPQVH